MHSSWRMFKASTMAITQVPTLVFGGSPVGQSGTLRVVTNSKTNANSFYSADNARFRLAATIAARRGCRHAPERETRPHFRRGNLPCTPIH